MGIDWEEQLGAEGADMARAYEDSLPEEDCGTTSHYVSGTRLRMMLLAHIFMKRWIILTVL